MGVLEQIKIQNPTILFTIKYEIYDNNDLEIFIILSLY